MNERSIGMRLAEALTKEQIVHLLDTAYRLWGKEAMKKLISVVDEDVAATLSRLLDPKAPPKERIVSDDKRMEEWGELWEKWEEIVFELGGEKGEYVYQEHHWEEPYFAADSFTDDLDQVAQKMLPLLKKIHAIGEEDDDVFEGALLGIEGGIEGYPEWMGADQDRCTLGAPTTECVLRWGWLTTGSAEDFVRNTAALESRFKIVGLSHAATVDFFRSLPEGDRRKVYMYINDHREEPFWQELLRSSHSQWHQIFYGFRSSFESEGYLEDCRRLLHEDWQYGFPLIGHLVSGGNYAEAEDIVEQTMASFLKAKWEPEESLLISVLKYDTSYGLPREDIISLLKDWMSLSEKLDKKERTAALQFQLVIYENPYHWDTVAKCFRDFNRPPFSQAAARLGGQWKDYVLHAQLGRDAARRGISDDCWVMWLLEMCLDDAADGARFISKTNEWLRSLLKAPGAQPKGQQDLLSMLTCDLMHFHEPAAKYRRLSEAICRAGEGGKELTASRRAWLKKAHADQLTPLVIQCWKNHVVHLVPDPAQAESSDYTRHARWLAALNELDPSACRTLINRWKEVHKRRRNLWKAIQEHGLPL
jgi:hypothetical protein